MKAITKGKVVAEVFCDIFEYRKTLSTRPVNKIFDGYSLSSQRENETEWYDSKSYEEADQLMFNYGEGMEKINAMPTTIKRDEPIRRNRQGVIGTAPNVSAFLKGHPLNMLYREKLRQDVKQINLYYDRGQHQGITADEIISSSRKLLDAVRMLEASGIQVAIYCLISFCTDEQIAIPIVKLKDATQPLSILKMSYTLVHPSFLRRHGFRWMETNPLITNKRFPKRGYGKPLRVVADSLDARRDFLIKHDVMTNRDVLIDCAALNNTETADELVKLLEKQTNKNLEQVRRAI